MSIDAVSGFGGPHGPLVLGEVPLEAADEMRLASAGYRAERLPRRGARLQRSRGRLRELPALGAAPGVEPLADG